MDGWAMIFTRNAMGRKKQFPFFKFKMVIALEGFLSHLGNLTLKKK